MRSTVLLVLALVAMPLAGCLGDDDRDRPPGQRTGAEDFPMLSAKRFDILPPEEVWVASAVDGKRINNVVYRPDTDEPVPVFINFSPYWGDTATTGGDNFATYLIEEYVPRGYAVVLSAVRGTGHSEGCFQIAGDLELQDTYDVVEHFANAAWSNGKVGAGGKSYDSTTQNGMVAKFPHPALETIFHVSGITDMYRYNYREGVPYGQGTIFNTYYYLQGTDEYGVSLIGAGDTTDEDPESLARLIDDVACVEFPFMQASGVGSGVSGLKDDYWIERDWNRYIGSSEWEGGIFFVHGLQDWNVKPDHILPWLEALPEGVEVKGWLHQWSRSPEGGHVYPMRDDWNLTMLRWLDHWLKDVDTGLLDEPRFQVEGTDEVWRESDTWPPLAAEAARTLPLGEETTEVGTLGVVHRADVLEAGSVQQFRYSGEPTLTLTATSTNEDPVLTATLYDRAPGGTLTWRNEGVLRAIYRTGLDAPEPVPQGEPVEYTLTFYPQDDVLEPGHAWVIEVGGQPLYAVPTPDQLQGITYDLSTAELSLVLSSVRAVEEPQPREIDCFAC